MDALTEAQERVGSLIDDRYKILDVMAAGSMGAVYKAERVPVGKIVAIKFLHASFASDSEFQARFERETRVMSKLSHPNCVSVVDFGVWQDEPYLVMDFVAGTTLRQLIDKGPLLPARALALTKQIAAGLAHAHAQDIVHRDIKPANIMITEEIGHGERVRILDFGLARLRGNVGRDATQTNMVVGTPNYMAPEQTVPGSNIDARTDIYAVGVVLFEMIVGDRPFHAEETLQLLGMHRAAPIPRIADRVREGTELPNGLQAVIDKAMAKAPDARYQSAIELAQAIDDVIAGKRDSMIDVTIPTAANRSGEALAPTMVHLSTENDAIDDEPPPRRSRFWRTMLTAMLLVGGAAAMAGYLIHRSNSKTPAQKMIDAAVIIDAAAGSAVVAAVVPDAAEVVVPPAAPDAAIDAPADAASIDAAEVVAVGSGSAGSGAGSASDEIEIDPNTAEDLDPAKGSAAQAATEAADEPESGSAAEAKAPEPPPAVKRATTIKEVLALIKDGQRETALASLARMHRDNPRSSLIPFLMGNLYFDKLWWSAAMDNYQEAIKKNSAYRNNPTLNKNVITMLGSGKTRQRATNFLRGVIGHPAAGYLRYEATHAENPVVRKQAAGLAKYIR
ncbi:MAG: serine/threonine protein kinase [Deltaproteobacteria bacterium]|nr:serine/threonine protein kinase [Deltaproteobacteria bacterium]